MIDVLAPLSDNILIVQSLGFLYSSEVPGLIWESILHGFGDKIITKSICNISLALNKF